MFSMGPKESGSLLITALMAGSVIVRLLGKAGGLLVETPFPTLRYTVDPLTTFRVSASRPSPGLRQVRQRLHQDDRSTTHGSSTTIIITLPLSAVSKAVAP